MTDRSSGAPPASLRSLGSGPPSSRRTLPNIEITIESTAMQRLLDRARRRMGHKEVILLVMNPGDDLELHSFAKRLDPLRPCRVVKDSDPALTECPKGIAFDPQDQSLIIQSGAKLVEAHCRELEATVKSRAFVIVLFESKESCGSFLKTRQAKDASTPWGEPLCWPFLSQRREDRPGLLNSCLRLLKSRQQHVQLTSKARELVTDHPFATVQDLYHSVYSTAQQVLLQLQQSNAVIAPEQFEIFSSHRPDSHPDSGL